MTRHKTAALAIGLALLAPIAAQAEEEVLCFPRAGFAAWYLEAGGLVPAAAGISAEGLLIETFANPETGAWAMIATGPDGESCELVHGSAWGLARRPGVGG